MVHDHDIWCSPTDSFIYGYDKEYYRTVLQPGSGNKSPVTLKVAHPAVGVWNNTPVPVSVRYTVYLESEMFFFSFSFNAIHHAWRYLL